MPSGELALFPVKYSLSPDVISTDKRVSYALGYVELGILSAAREELESIPRQDSRRPDVLMARVELAMAESDWEAVTTLCPDLVVANPADERPWIAWGYALRELQQITTAREVLLRAEHAILKPSVLVDYNLACYHALLGDLKEARRRLNKVFVREPSWVKEAADDPDLSSLHPM